MGESWRQMSWETVMAAVNWFQSEKKDFTITPKLASVIGDHFQQLSYLD